VSEYPHSYEDVDALRAALFGRSVVAVKMGSEQEQFGPYGPNVQGEVHLNDGTVLLLAGNGPNCSCSAGDYDLVRLNEMPINGITDVDIDIDIDGLNEYGEGLQTYRIFVLAFGGRFELAAFEGDDGNGYYGTGFWFNVAAK
jgi:hypothetical protein